MATLQQDQKDDSKERTTPVGVGAVPSAANSGRVANYSTGTQGASTQGSGRFTNLKSYINANQGAGDQLGSKITKDLKQDVTKASDQSQAANIRSAVEAEKNRLSEGTQFNQQLQDRNTDGAVAIAGNQDSANRFSQLLNNQNIASNLAQQNRAAQVNQINALNQASQNVSNLGTEKGRFQLLQKSIQNPNYTSGQQRLDQLFLQTGNPNQLAQSQQQLGRDIRQSAGTLEDIYSGIGTDITAAGKQAVDVANMLRGTLGAETSALSEAQIKEAQALNTQNAVANAALQVYFTNGYGALTPEQKAAIDPMLQSGNLSSGMRTYNVLTDPQAYQKYLTEGSVDLTGKDVLDANELARYNALYSLSGGTGDKIFNEVGKGGVQAGIKDTLSSDINAARSALTQELDKLYKFDPLSGSGYWTSSQANYLDLLKQLEQSNPAYSSYTNNQGLVTTGRSTGDDVFQIGTGKGQDSRFDVNLDPWNAHASGMISNLGNTGKKDAQYLLLQDFLNRINQSGYTNTLGGESASDTLSQYLTDRKINPIRSGEVK